MSKEAEILRKCVSCHDEHMCQKSRKSRGVMYLRCVSLKKVTLNYFEIWFNSSTFPTYGNWKSIVENKVRDLESRLCLEFCSGYPNMHFAQACLENVSPSKFWSLSDLYPDLVSPLHTQVRLMGNLCLNGGIPLLNCVSPF